jgi:hypothetical protein
MSGKRRKRRPDWVLALAMLAGMAVPIVLMAYFFGPATWSAVVAGLLGWPCAFIGGCIALIGEDKSGW